MEPSAHGPATAPPRRLGGLAAALAAEARKARSFPAVGRTLLLGALSVLGAAVFGMVQMSRFAARGDTDALMGLSMADWPLLLLHYGQVIPILLAGWVVGQDAPAGARRTAFLATARRGRLIAAKLVITGLLALLAGFVCAFVALVPLAAAGGRGEGAVPLAPYGWLIGYWGLIALVTGSLVAATRSIAFSVVPVLVWTIGASDLLVARAPALSGALDQAFKSAYMQGGAAPSAPVLAAAGAQAVVAVVVGSALFIRRDVQ